MANSGDPYVLNVQKWVNSKFGDNVNYTEIVENGLTGWSTIYALLHGLQITLDVGSIANNFGDGTANAFNSFIHENGNIQLRTKEQDSELHDSYENASGKEKEKLEKLITQYENIHGIIQGALICKGYSIGANTPTGNFYGGTGTAIINLKQDAGLNDTTTIVTLNIIKALLSMDYFYSYDTSEKIQNTINMQRYLNRNYEEYIGIRPCDGIYSRRTNEALVYAIQAEEDLPVSTANGNFGPTTKNCCPTIPYNNIETSYLNTTYNKTKISNFTKLMKIGLYVNGFGDGDFEGSINQTIVTKFQEKYALTISGICNIGTWLSLFTSNGDTARSAIACDCATIINNTNINVLKDNNYQYIGRYLSGTIGGGISKALSTTELQLLFNNGIRVFPIHQRSANSISYFTDANAIIDAGLASQYADELNLQFGAIIYFAVDFDALDYQITDNIIPYFKKLYSTFMTKCRGKYRLGIYGTRNVCTRVCDAGYACSSFVGDMSTGFSGNLGFPIPDNWALDQFATVKISSGEDWIEIDKDGFSGQYNGISQEYYNVNNNYYDGSILDDGTTVRTLINITDDAIPVYESKTYVLPEDGIPQTPNRRLDGAIIGYIKPNEFYLRYALHSQEYDNIHRVMFNDGTDVKIGYVQEHGINFGMFEDPYSDEAVRFQIPAGQDVFTCFHYNPSTSEYDKNIFGSVQEFTINKPVPYFNSSTGTYEGTLQKGDKIKISGGNNINPGYSRPWCNRVDQIKWKGNNSFESFSKYVSIGIEYAGSGSERAWY